MNPYLIVTGIVALFFLTKKSGSSNVEGMRQALISDATSNQTDTDANTRRYVNILLSMTADEIRNTYDFIFNYVRKNIQVVQGSPLYFAIVTISNKYQIFT